MTRRGKETISFICGSDNPILNWWRMWLFASSSWTPKRRRRWRDGGPPNHEIKNTKYPTGRSQDWACSDFTDGIVSTGAKIMKRSLKKKKKKSLPDELEEEGFAGCASIHKPRRCELHELRQPGKFPPAETDYSSVIKLPGKGRWGERMCGR